VKILDQALYLRVADMPRSVAFYCDGLGFHVENQLDEDGVPFFARLERDGIAILVSTRASRFVADAVHDHSSGEAHEHGEFHGAEVVHGGALNLLTYIYVDDVDGAFADLRSMGISTVDEPEDKFYGLREFLVRDPDGYYLALAQRL
jgi:catechol 2,3-dioxygenase-like lactoylglutathione lyase family enzyme